jgi:hypothetical protein
MGAFTMQGNADAVSGGEDGTNLRADFSSRKGKYMLRERYIGLRYQLAQAIVHHRLRTTGKFFRRLEKRNEGPRPRRATFRK